MTGRAETQIQKSAFSTVLHCFGKNTRAGSTYWNLKKKHREKENKGRGDLQRFRQEAGKMKGVRKSEEKEV